VNATNRPLSQGGIAYSSSSGIWQTVWLETLASETAIDSVVGTTTTTTTATTATATISISTTLTIADTAAATSSTNIFPTLALSIYI